MTSIFGSAKTALTTTLTDNVDVQNTRSVIVAKNSSGVYQNVPSDQYGNLVTTASLTDRGAFGEISTGQLTPVIAEKFIYNVNSRIFTSTVANSGTVTQAFAMAIVSSGTTTGSTAALISKRRARYRPGQGIMARFTAVFSTPVAGTCQLIGVGDDQNGFFFGYDGTSFGILHRNNAVDTWVYQANWVEDPADGSKTLPLIDWEKGNVLAIQYQFLGFGSIRFFIERSHPGDFILCHSIDYANNHIVPSLRDATLPFRVFVDNLATTSDVTVKTASCAVFVEGLQKAFGLTNAMSNSKSGIGSTETNIITLRNVSTYAGKPNNNLILPQLLNVSTISGTKPSTIRLTTNTSLGGTPSYTAVDANTSIQEYDTAGTTLSGGNIVFTAVLGKEESASYNLSALNIIIAPGETLTVSAATPSGSVEVFVSLTSRDDV